ncbi:MAG: response regulator [Acidobacteria bacterium]|nr:response regulator [Acidobacteriota bacterium]
MSDLRHVRLLVVDDDPQALALVEMALVDAHFERQIEVIPTAAAGLERIKANHHDVYLVDHRLPDGTGITLIHDAKAAGIDKPFILITGYGSGALDEAALREGAADYVEKHLLGAQLERSIRYALRDWQASRALKEGDERLDPSDPTSRDAREIRRAADRATALTQQLLAFSRKQFLDATVLDVNEAVLGLIQMLPRVIGEHIETTTRLSADLRPVWADASQMDQVLINLALNARDAMAGGGRLTIETANVDLDEDRLRAEALALPPGRYVMLSVSDTGTGMDEATRARAFEPFFTTKPKGKGTGLGLATVYGIVDQSGGGIALDTEPGRGTAVRLYLPVTSAVAARLGPPESQPLVDGGGTETILLVEDHDSVREVTAQALRRRGYTVYEARNAEEAIEWSSHSPVRPDLLLTDVVMPGLSGPNLAARLVQQKPGIRVLYMSGYTDDATAVHGSFWGGVPLLPKPFTPARLAERVRLALDTPVRRV